jgi:hypothetical protein
MELHLEADSVLSGLKNSVKQSIGEFRSPAALFILIRHCVTPLDKTMQIYKASTLAQVTGRNTPARSLSADRMDDAESRRSHSERQSWEDDDILRDGTLHENHPAQPFLLIC